MKPLGSVLMITGLVVGIALGLAMAAGVTIPGVGWIIAVGLAKLTMLAAIGLIAAGAALHRLAARAAARDQLASGPRSDEEL